VRSVASEILSAAVVLAVPTAIVASFPFGAFSFRAENGVQRSVRTAFVQMSPQAERLALRTARTSWQAKGAGARRLQADIFCSELPEEAPQSVLSVRDRSRPPSPPALECGLMPFLPSLKAPPPVPIKAANVTEPPAFPREELLMMN